MEFGCISLLAKSFCKIPVFLITHLFVLSLALECITIPHQAMEISEL